MGFGNIYIIYLEVLGEYCGFFDLEVVECVQVFERIFGFQFEVFMN